MSSYISYLNNNKPKLEEKALYGPAGEFVSSIKSATEADPAAIFLQILVGIGNIIGRSNFSKVGATKHFTNLFVVLIGLTSKGRKGTSLNIAKQFLSYVNNNWANNNIYSGLSSGEGLIYSIRDIENDENNEVITDKRKLIIESEMVSVLKNIRREGNTLSPVLRDIWDNDKPLQTMTKNTPIKATGGHISLIGHITENELKKSLNSLEINNGFGNRILWVLTERKNIIPNGDLIDESAYIQYATLIRSNIENIEKNKVFQRNVSAEKLWTRIYHELSVEKHGISGALTARAEAQVIRLSSILATIDGTYIISHDHLSAAYSLWKYCEQTCEYIFGKTTGNNLSDRILDQLETAEDVGLSRSEISDCLGRNKSKKLLNEALSTLYAQNKAFCTTPNGGGTNEKERWYHADFIETFDTHTTYDTQNELHSNIPPF